jgi:hypothetical protein
MPHWVEFRVLVSSLCHSREIDTNQKAEQADSNSNASDMSSGSLRFRFRPVHRPP